ncbi:MAG: NUDIX domain-containing protein [Candidatus Bathyarchaeota archaeon]|jgi:ADP-ribose pyrophosphatase YjhB (NUDIX family)
MTERFVRVGARAVIFNEDNELLVEHRLRPEEDYYYLPGGGVWFQEKIEDCLVREVKEETGLDVKTERLLWVRDFIEGLPYPPHGIEMFFLATITGGKFRVQPINDPEPIECSFMKVEDLESIRFYPTSFIPKLKKLRDNRNWSGTNVYLRTAP